MSKRYVSIWFRHLRTDWFSILQPALKQFPLVLSSPDHGRMVITASNALAEAQGVFTGMVLADARVIVPGLHFLDDQPGIAATLLTKLAERFIVYTPWVSVDGSDGLILDATGCAHLWGGEKEYLTHINIRLKRLGYSVRIAMADTIGAAWAIARFGEPASIIEPGEQANALLSLPPAALRLQSDITERLEKLGLRQIRNFISMPRSALRRRFGEDLIHKLDQALGYEIEIREPVQPIQPYVERLPCLEPIVTATGIEIALERLLATLCNRLLQEEKGLRTCYFKCYRVDGNLQKLEIGTHRATHHATHLFKLFEPKLPSIEPDLGIELFVLEAPKTEELSPIQEKLWEGSCGLNDSGLLELMDRLANKIGTQGIRRFLPDEHHWPERSYRTALSLQEKLTTTWRTDKLRPMQLLARPEPIEVTAPIPDYPPMTFRYKNNLHTIKKADGPERIESEWWLEEGPLRDYYAVEDQDGQRYWLFRLGHFSEAKAHKWFIHGFFA